MRIMFRLVLYSRSSRLARVVLPLPVRPRTARVPPWAIWTLMSFSAGIAYVPQDSFLFSDTLENNIAFGAEARDRCCLSWMPL